MQDYVLTEMSRIVCDVKEKSTPTADVFYIPELVCSVNFSFSLTLSTFVILVSPEAEYYD